MFVTHFSTFRATFSPVDVIEEYTRPARVKKDGKVVIIDDPIADPEKITVQGMDLEAFVSDGCRSLLDLVCETNDRKDYC